jgi:hypothetical protein
LGGIFGGIFCGITVRFLTKDLIPNTIAKKRAQQDTDTNVSLVFGEINTINPRSLIKAEKLETQNGMR